MKLITMTSLDDDEVEVENYDTDTGAYSQLRAKHPVVGVEDLVTAGAVSSGYLVGATTESPPDLSYPILSVVFAGKLAVLPPEDSFADVSSPARGFVSSRQCDRAGVVLTTSGAFLIAQAGGAVVYDRTPYGTWPVPSTDAFHETVAMQMVDRSIRLVEVDAAEGLLRVSTPLGAGNLNVAAHTALPVPPEGTTGEYETREYGAMALAKVMNLTKAYGAPAHIIGSVGISNEVGFPVTLGFEQYQSVTCPDSSGQYTVCRYGDTGPELARYTANAGYTAFTAGTVDTFPNPTSPTVDTFWFVPTDPTPGAFWQKFKRAEEQV